MKKLFAAILSLVLSSIAHAHYFDIETGLDYNMNRDYDSQSGRYIESVLPGTGLDSVDEEG